MVRVAILTSVHPWKDVRILQREAVSLAKEFQVEYYAPADFEGCEYEGVKIYGLPEWKSVADRRRVRQELWKKLKESRAEVIHFHDPELIWMGIKLKLFRRKKVIYDVHEDYPRAILDKSWIPVYLRRIVSCAAWLMEMVGALLFDGVICVTEPVRKRFSRWNKNTVIIGNYPIVSYRPKGELTKNPDELIYVGGINEKRGFCEILRAMRILIDRGLSRLRLVVLGAFESQTYEKKIRDLIRDLKLDGHVIFKGKLEYKEMFATISRAEIGLVTYLPYANNMVCLPNKMFEYMLSGTAICASDFEIYREIIEASGAGKTVDPTSPEKIADLLEQMLKDKEGLRKMGENGLKAILEYYNWAYAEKELMKLYKRILC